MAIVQLKNLFPFFSNQFRSVPLHFHSFQLNKTALSNYSQKDHNLPFKQCLFIDHNGTNHGQMQLNDIQTQFPFDDSLYKLRIVNFNPPTCRLVSISDYIKSNTQNTGAKIKDKDIYFGTATSDHDLQIKCGKMIPWLQKKYNVRIIVEKKGSITEQRSKESILQLVLSQLEGYFQKVGKEIVDESRIIMNIKGLGKQSEGESS